MMLRPLRRYADFEGRSRRKEYWLWVLFNFLLLVVLWGVLAYLAITAVHRVEDRGGVYTSESSSYDGYEAGRYTDEESGGFDRYEPEVTYGWEWAISVDPEMFVEEFSPLGWAFLALAMLWKLITFIPSLAVAIRRMHDVDKSGWMLLLGLIPLVGMIVLLVFFLMEGTRGPNLFGPDPKVRDYGYPY